MDENISPAGPVYAAQRAAAGPGDHHLPPSVARTELARSRGTVGG